jgi:LacI family transcriptional regulator
MAGVSVGTVSLVINGSKLVAGRTRDRVAQAIQELGYVYDRGAAQLRSRRTRMVGLSVCSLINPYFAEVTSGIEGTLNDAGYALLMGNCNESVVRQTRFLEILREYNVDGILIVPGRDTKSKDLSGLVESGIPFVMVSRYVRDIKCDYAGPSNRRGTMAATRYLIGLGHRRIAYIGSNRGTTSGLDRDAGYRAAMRSAGLELDPDLIVECGETRQDGFQVVHALFKRRAPPTAVVCFNDVLAFGVMLGLRDLGLVPGKDCSVVGHDDVAEAALWRPPLTTVAVSSERIGIAAAELLQTRLEGSTVGTQRRILETSLVIRETCGPPAEKLRRKRANRAVSPIV